MNTDYPPDLAGVRPKNMTDEQLRRVPVWPGDKPLSLAPDGVMGEDLLFYQQDADGNWWREEFPL